jgi:hypothetical protein
MSSTERIRALARAGRTAEAEEELRTLITRLFALPAENLAINADQYSLNSLNGFFEAGAENFFFKFHQEENEESMSGEYYRAGILADAGLPVDMPVHVSTQPGEQILIYRRRNDPRFADILRTLDSTPDPASREAALAAERALSAQIFETYARTLHPITPAQSAAEPIHRLFHHRLTDAGAFPGGRYASFYIGQNFALPGLEIPWPELKTLRFTINGIEYRGTLESLFAQAATALHPASLATAGGLTAHGDAHNANVWFQNRQHSPPRVFPPRRAARKLTCISKRTGASPRSAKTFSSSKARKSGARCSACCERVACCRRTGAAPSNSPSSSAPPW